MLQQKLLESVAKVKAEQNKTEVALKKLEHVEKVASQRIVESMPFSNFEEDCNHLAMLFATVLDKDDFIYNSESDNVEPKSADDFLRRVKDNCGEIADSDAKLMAIKNKVLDKMKRTLKRERRLSTSGSVHSVDSVNSRSSSKTRRRSVSEETESHQKFKQSRISRIPAPKN